MSQTIPRGRFYCAGCVINCGRIVRVEEFGKVNGAGAQNKAWAPWAGDLPP